MKMGNDAFIKFKKEIENAGIDYYSDEDIIDYMNDLREDQVMAITNKQIDIFDLDKWRALENVTRVELDCSGAMEIINKLWEYGVDVVDIPYNSN